MIILKKISRGMKMISNVLLLALNVLSGCMLVIGVVKRDKWYSRHHEGLNRANLTWRYSMRFAIGGLLLVTALDELGRIMVGGKYEALLQWYVTGLGVWYSYHLCTMRDVK